MYMEITINRWVSACIYGRNAIKLFELLALCFVAAMSYQEHAYARSLGVMLHYLPETVSVEAIQSSAYKKTIARMKDINVNYVIITIGQNNGEYWLRSKQLTKTCNDYKDQNIEKADYFEKLVDEMLGTGISVYFYLPFRAPQNDKNLMSCLHDTGEKNEPSKYFLVAWSDIVREWRIEYEKRISGWWIDGVYKTKSIEKSDWDFICDAFVGKDNKLLVAFNPGEGANKLGQKLASCQNLEAGEVNDIRFAKRISKTINNIMSPHLLTFITDHWGTKGPIKYSLMDIRRLCHIEQPKTMLTFDVPIEKNFEISEVYFDWLEKAIKVCNEKVH